MNQRCRSLLLAFVFDWFAGELPNAVHPVVWFGRWFTIGERLAPSGNLLRLLWGGGWLAAGMTVVYALTARLPRYTLLHGALVSTLLAYRALDQAVAQVHGALSQGDLPEARRLLSWHLVSRPTADLSEAEVAAAAIESLAENMSDSVVAPSLCYLVGGLPLLAVYRLCNTADAMWGYRSQRYEYLGKLAARCDDVLNLIPARLTAMLIGVAAQLVNRRGPMAWQVALNDHRRTESPNAGWPMAAMAGALDTTLSKRGHYSLGDGARCPDMRLLAEGRAIARHTMLVLIGIVIMVSAIEGGTR